MKTIYTILIIIILFSSAKSEEQGNYILTLTDGRTIVVSKFEFEKDGKILLHDMNDLERILNIAEIAKINKLNVDEKFYECVTLIDGNEICGDLLEYKPGDFISISVKGKDTLFFQVNNIKNLKVNESKMEATVYQNYLEYGLNIGFPAGLNLIVGYWYGPFGLHLSGSYIFIANGMQLDFSYKIYEKSDVRHSFSLVAGISNIQKDKFGSGGNLKNFHWEYNGITYNAFFHGFWVEFGFSDGYGNYNSPQPIFQLGYIYRLK